MLTSNTKGGSGCLGKTMIIAFGNIDLCESFCEYELRVYEFIERGTVLRPEAVELPTWQSTYSRFLLQFV
ncbi:hypothetical protein L6452_28909 [Arctium lappa]|uniref:Uncharacterized protein n=1 Tax=Arctium lappa TaxID=4217 RepID=A0ACB8ZZT2_ARCLA|nr:hypothetical protein L6452_28909 [Arctium lappa]